MPLGNSLIVCFSIFSFILGCIRPSVLFLIRVFTFIPSMISKGSKIFPFDFDIFWPSESLTKPCINIFLKGTSEMKCVVIIIILATQKKIISNPVTNTSVGWYFFNKLSLEGHPRVEKVHSAEENQVSRTSSSCLIFFCEASSYFCLTLSSLSATKIFPSSSNQAGILWPHQICLLMHQS